MSQNSFLCTFFSHPQDRQSGDYLHRIAWPGKALGRLTPVRAIQSSHPDHLGELLHSDVLVIQMVADARLLDVVKKRRQLGKTTVFEISDDFTAFPPHLPGHAFYARKDVQQTIAILAETSDAVQFSSIFLERKYGYLNAARATFPNQLPSVPSLKPRVKRMPRLGWAGSLGHLEDAKRLADMLSRWPLKRQVRLHVMAAGQIVELFRAAGLDVKGSEPGSMSAYLDFLRQIDIGVAIANTDDFSSGRSDGKFIEYASRGVIAVCSSGPPYADSVDSGNTGLLFDDEQELQDALTHLVGDPGNGERIRRQAYEYVRDNRTHTRAAQDRVSFYSGLFNSGKARSSPANRGSATGYREMIGDIEPRFLQAMLLHRDGRIPEAIQIYTQLAEQAPNFHLLWERMGQACDAIGARQQAAACNERARLLIEQEYSRYDIAIDAQGRDPAPGSP